MTTKEELVKEIPKPIPHVMLDDITRTEYDDGGSNRHVVDYSMLINKMNELVDEINRLRGTPTTK